MLFHCFSGECRNNLDGECTGTYVEIVDGRCSDYELWQASTTTELVTLRKPLAVTTRRTETTAVINIGDQIAVGHYTATAHKLNDDGTVLFIMDQYDDEPRPMYEGEVTGGYQESDLRKYLNSDEGLAVFGELHCRLVPFENGDLVRIPTVSELFGAEECEDFCEDDGADQLPLMKLRQNRVAYRKNETEWGQLQNKVGATSFATVDDAGCAVSGTASYVAGVRRAFLID